MLSDFISSPARSGGSFRCSARPIVETPEVAGRNLVNSAVYQIAVPAAA